MRDVKWSLWDANDFCVAARIRLMTSRCRGLSRSLYGWTSREKRRNQCLWNFLNIFTKIRFIITPNSSLDSAWIAAQESETLVTIRNQLSRIFDTEHGGTLSPHAQTFKVFRMHNRTVNCFRWIHSIATWVFFGEPLRISFLSVNQMMIKSLDKYFSATVFWANEFFIWWFFSLNAGTQQ